MPVVFDMPLFLSKTAMIFPLTSNDIFPDLMFLFNFAIYSRYHSRTILSFGLLGMSFQDFML